MKILEKKYFKSIRSDTAYGCACMTAVIICIILIMQMISLLDARREMLQAVHVETMEQEEEEAETAMETEKETGTDNESIQEADLWEQQLRPGKKEYEWQKAFEEIPDVLDIPIKMQEELFIYAYAEYGLEQYAAEDPSLADVSFYCDLNEDWLHWDTEIWDEYLLYRCEILGEIPYGSRKNRYVVRLQDPERNVYMIIDTYDAVISIYSKLTTPLSESGEYDWFETAKQKKDERGWLINEDIYVTPDWYRPDEEYFDVPWYPSLSGYVQYAITCYCEDHGIEEEFTFDLEEDKIAVATDQLFTVRARSAERSIYIDIDREYGHFHIYEIE